MPEAAMLSKFLPMLMGSSGGGKSGGAGMSSGGGGGGSMVDGAGVGKSMLSLGSGLLQNLQAHNLKNKANQAMPPLVDPNQAAFLSELHQKRKSIETGADFAAGENALGATNAGTNDAILRSEGGDVGGTIQGLLQSQRSTNDAKNNMLAQGENQQAQYTGMYGDFLNKIAARKLQLQMYNSQQARAEWAQKQQTANQNTMAGLGGLLSGKQASPSSGQNGGQTQQGSAGGGVDTSVLQGMLQKTAGAGGMGQSGEGVEGITSAAAGMA